MQRGDGRLAHVGHGAEAAARRRVVEVERDAGGALHRVLQTRVAQLLLSTAHSTNGSRREVRKITADSFTVTTWPGVNRGRLSKLVHNRTKSPLP